MAAECLEWCKKVGNDPSLRIVLAGYNSEHSELMSMGWRCVEWFKGGFLKGGMANIGDKGTQQGNERLWLSPHCLVPTQAIDSFDLAKSLEEQFGED